MDIFLMFRSSEYSRRALRAFKTNESRIQFISIDKQINIPTILKHAEVPPSTSYGLPQASKENYVYFAMISDFFRTLSQNQFKSKFGCLQYTQLKNMSQFGTVATGLGALTGSMSATGGTAAGLFSSSSSLGSISVTTIGSGASAVSSGATFAGVGTAVLGGLAAVAASAVVAFGFTDESDFDEGGYFNHE